MKEDEMIEWHHRLNGHEFEQIPGEGEGKRSLACCSSWGCKELDTTQQPNNNNITKAGFQIQAIHVLNTMGFLLP